MNIKKFIGAAILVVIFGGFFLTVGLITGFNAALGIFLAAFILSALIILAVYLLCE